MTARSNIQSLSGATLWLSATRPATFDSPGYVDSLIAWTLVGQVEDFGDHGMEAQIIEFTAVADAVVQKLKGSKNYGTMTMTIGNVPSDAGQILIATASESQNRYSARILYALGDGEVTPESHYLDVLVSSRKFTDGSVNNVRKTAVALALCRKQVEVAAT
ncbi:MAG TPA: phage tail tube protein [Usitatibacter sp.]|nr:phage tail tube protein [Usitatibacter sp.]